MLHRISEHWAVLELRNQRASVVCFRKRGFFHLKTVEWHKSNSGTGTLLQQNELDGKFAYENNLEIKKHLMHEFNKL